MESRREAIELHQLAFMGLRIFRGNGQNDFRTKIHSIDQTSDDAISNISKVVNEVNAGECLSVCRLGFLTHNMFENERESKIN